MPEENFVSLYGTLFDDACVNYLTPLAYKFAYCLKQMNEFHQKEQYIAWRIPNDLSHARAL